MERTIHACPDHAPVLFDPVSNDDGAPTCQAEGCSKRNYAVKPFVLTGNGADQGWWRTASGRVNVKGPR